MVTKRLVLAKASVNHAIPEHTEQQKEKPITMTRAKVLVCRESTALQLEQLTIQFV